MNKGYLFILTTAFLFGTMETALKFFGSLFHPIQITVLRFFIGGFMLLPLARAALKRTVPCLPKRITFLCQSRLYWCFCEYDLLSAGRGLWKSRCQRGPF